MVPYLCRRRRMSLSSRLSIWNKGHPPDFKKTVKPPPFLFDFRVHRARPQDRAYCRDNHLPFWKGAQCCRI